MYHAPLNDLVLLDYRGGRSRADPNEMLTDFSGYLQIDAYAGYNDFTAKPDVIAAGRFAHTRRYFKNVLARIADHPFKQLALLLSPNWSPVNKP